ncbi:MAG: hypothetical protein ACRCVX_01690 [Shewanella sp.]
MSKIESMTPDQWAEVYQMRQSIYNAGWTNSWRGGSVAWEFITTHTVLAK